MASPTQNLEVARLLISKASVVKMVKVQVLAVDQLR